MLRAAVVLTQIHWISISLTTEACRLGVYFDVTIASNIIFSFLVFLHQTSRRIAPSGAYLINNIFAQAIIGCNSKPSISSVDTGTRSLIDRDKSSFESLILQYTYYAYSYLNIQELVHRLHKIHVA